MDLNLLLIALGGSLLVLDLLARVIKRLFLSTVLIALAIGVAIGPEGIAIVERGTFADDRHVMEKIAEVTLAIALTGTGLHVTPRDLSENLRRYASLLTVGMVGMWVAAGLGAWLLLDLPFWAGFLLGAVLTPTDPAVASTLVTGPLAEGNLSRRVRRTLQIEAGGNDGLALPFVLLAAYVLTRPAGAAVGDWALETVKQVGLAVTVGLAIGYVAGKTAELSFRASEAERTSLLGTGLALALLALGLVAALGGSGILAAFVAALVFSALLGEDHRAQIESAQETIVGFFILPAFVFFGTILPWDEWVALGLPGLAFVAWVLLVRRPPVIPLALAGSGTPRREVVFLSWFGPLGVAAIYYATYIERFDIPDAENIFAAATLAVCGSVLIHSITATPGVRAVAGRSPFRTLRDPLHPESETAP